ncbi:MAG: SRPBCC family protein [Thaumarchaeota archaeon]|nr:SRPBCC family protein [Nitrososphaerota archaeon]
MGVCSNSITQMILVLISEKITINASSDVVWNHLRTLQGAEQYLTIVTKSEVNGTGLGTTRTCDIKMGEQKFQIKETLVKLDDSQKSLTILIDDAPPAMKDLQINYSVSGNGDSSDIVINNEFEHTPESEQMIKGILNMICTGLKKYHEQ